MRKTLKIVGLSLLILVVLAIFTIWNLPSQALRNYVEYTVNQQLPGQQISIGSLEVKLTGLKLQDVTLHNKWAKQEELLHFDSIYGYFSLFSLLTGKIRFQGLMYNGYIRGYYSFIFDKVYLGFADIELRGIPSVAKCKCILSRSPIQGSFTMQDFDLQRTIVGIEAKNITFNINKKQGLFITLPKTTINDFKLEIKGLPNKNQFTILMASSGDIGSNINGTLSLNNSRPIFSLLNIKLEAIPKPSYLPALKPVLPFLQGYMDSSNRLRVAITGRFPGINIRKI